MKKIRTGIIILISIILIFCITFGIYLTINKSENVSIFSKLDETDEYIRAGNSLKEAGEYLNAIDEYEKVDINSKKNYLNAQQFIQECKDAQYSIDIKKADELHQQGKFIDAYDTGRQIENYYGNIDEKLNVYKDSISKDSIEKSKLLLNEKEFDEAIAIIDGALKYCPNDTVLLKEKDNIIIEKEKAKKEAEEQKEKKKKELLTKTTFKYDDMEENTTIVPKGYSTRYINLNRSINLELFLVQ